MAAHGEELDPFSDEFIDFINANQNSWRAGRNFPEHTHLSFFKNRLHYGRLPVVVHDAKLIASLPESFDPRDKWPNCPSLNEIRDQGACGSCWAFGAVEAMTDRYCIHSNGQNFHFSAHDLLSCCSYCGDCKQGGLASLAWSYWNSTGIVSGGNYNSNKGCRPYGIVDCSLNCGPEIVPTPKCVRSCESSYNVGYDQDLRRGKQIYRISSNEDQIKAELFQNGPVEASFKEFSDFATYKDGVYTHLTGHEKDKHYVKILGWGVEKGQKYWLVANSWSSLWGDHGFFKILRGQNHCGIEAEIITGIPLIE